MFELAYELRVYPHDRRRRPLAVDWSTGQKVRPIGGRTAEGEVVFDLFLFEDSKRQVPFVFENSMEVARLTAGSQSIPVTSVLLQDFGVSWYERRRGGYHVNMWYDQEVFRDKAHEYLFSSIEEFQLVCERAAECVRLWQLFRPRCRDISSRPYQPNVVVEVLFEEAPQNLRNEQEKRDDRWFRLKSAYRSPHIEWQGVLKRRELYGGPRDEVAKLRSPWGGKYVEAIRRDCNDAQERAVEAAWNWLEVQRRTRIESEQELLHVLESLETPISYERLTHALQRCEQLPRGAMRRPCSPGVDPTQHLWKEPFMKVLAQAASDQGWTSEAELLTHLVEAITHRTREIAGFQ